MADKPQFLGLRTAKYAGPDIAKAKEWYTKATGVKPYFDEPFYVGFEIGGYELGIVPDAKPGDSGIAYWGVDDANAAHKRLLTMGATPDEPVTDVGGGILIGSVKDPFGNVFGIIQNPHFKGGK